MVEAVIEAKLFYVLTSIMNMLYGGKIQGCEIYGHILEILFVDFFFFQRKIVMDLANANGQICYNRTRETLLELCENHLVYL